MRLWTPYVNHDPAYIVARVERRPRIELVTGQQFNLRDNSSFIKIVEYVIYSIPTIEVEDFFLRSSPSAIPSVAENFPTVQSDPPIEL